MKNKLISLGLIAGFSLAALSSCSAEYTYLKKGNDQVILTIGGEDITVEQLLADYKTTNSTGIEAYYNAISEVLVRKASEEYAKTSECTTYVDAKVTALKENAKESADSNGTSYKEELNSALKNEGVEDLDAYKDKVKYEKLQDHLQDEYYDNHKSEMLEDYINTVLPYHVRHLLVKTSASNDLANYTISSSEAVKLATSVRRLANLNADGTAKATTETFGQVAKEMSEDETSAKQYGDLGIMTTKTSYVNEFKLGIYAYEALYSAKTNARASYLTDNTKDSSGEESYLKNNTYAIPTEYQNAVSTRTETINDYKFVSGTSETDEVKESITLTRRENGIGYIPFEYSQLLETYKDTEKTKEGKLVNDGDSTYYPRNIIFSTFFNDHGINVITNDTEVGNFKIIDGLFDNRPVLCADGDVNKVILVTRASSSYEGVHFMVIEKSPITNTIEALKNYYNDKTSENLNKGTDEEKALIGNTFVTYFTSTSSSTESTRSTTVKEEIKGYDSNLDAKIFKFYLNECNATIADDDIAKSIDNYITYTEASTKSSNITSNEDAWKEYIRLLAEQDIEVEADRHSLYAASKFTNGYWKGDGCYHEK